MTISVGVLGAFLLESLDNTVKSAEDVNEKLDLPLLGIVPLIKKKTSPPNDPLLDSVDPRFEEAIGTIRTSVSLDNLDNPHKIILLTSSVAF